MNQPRRFDLKRLMLQRRALIERGASMTEIF